MVADALTVGTRVPEQFDGRVVAAFDRAIYIRTAEGALIVVLAEGLGPAPHAVVIPRPEPTDDRGALRTHVPEAALGASATLHDGLLQIDTTTPPDGEGRIKTLDTWRVTDAARYDGTLAAAHVDPAASAAAAIAVGIAVGTATIPRQPSIAAHARMLVAENIRDLARAMRSGRTSDDAFCAVWALIGLGPGLTPSGDDALVGFLAARWALAASGGAVGDIVSQLLGRTTAVSGSYLGLAAEGRFAEPLASLARATADGDAAAASAHARACLSVGATSGADGVLGFLGGYASWDGTHAGGWD